MRPHPSTKPMLDFVQTMQRAVTRSCTARYFERVDAHIADMDTAASLTFLRAELDKWMARYQRFQAQVDGDRYEGSATSWEYAETIATLGTRIAQLERQQVAA